MNLMLKGVNPEIPNVLSYQTEIRKILYIRKYRTENKAYTCLHNNYVQGEAENFWHSLHFNNIYKSAATTVLP